MKSLIIALSLVLASQAFAEQVTGVLVNPRTGYVAPIVVLKGATVKEQHLSRCGPGCEFTDFLWPGQCMIVSISIRDAAYGYSFGPRDDLANIRSQAHRYCQRYGGEACKEYPPVCG